MKAVRIGLFLCVTVLAGIAKAAPMVEVRSHTDVSERRMVTLGDLAEFTDLSDALVGQLKALRLAEAPNVGERVEFAGASLSDMLRGQEAFRLLTRHKVLLKIPHRVVVENIGNRLTPFQVTDRLMNHWQSLCGQCRIVIESLSLPQIATWQVGTDWKLNLRPDLPRGSFTVALEITSPKAERQTFWVTGRVTYFREVPVAKRSLNLGERVQPTDFGREERDVTFASDTSPGMSEIVGRKLRRGISANEILFNAMLERERALSRGDVVAISIGEPGWEVSLSGQAEQDGYIGDTVKIRNLKSNQVVSALVTGKGEVKVE